MTQNCTLNFTNFILNQTPCQTNERACRCARKTGHGTCPGEDTRQWHHANCRLHISIFGMEEPDWWRKHEATGRRCEMRKRHSRFETFVFPRVLVGHTFLQVGRHCAAGGGPRGPTLSITGQLNNFMTHIALGRPLRAKRSVTEALYK